MKNILLYFLVIASLITSCKKGEATSTTESASDLEISSVEYVDIKANFDESARTKSKIIDSLFKLKYPDGHPTIFVDSEKYYIVEGDILLPANEYLEYKLSNIVRNPSQYKMKPKLIIGFDGQTKKVLKWDENYIIKYAIDRKSFLTKDQYNIVKENMEKAYKEWETTCNVKFEYVNSLDNDKILVPSEELTFVVKGLNTNDKFIASAFFPNTEIKNRLLYVDPKYFTTTYNQIGVFRHEIGHILGFKHEHLRDGAPLACKGERLGSVKPFGGDYDPQSVMHYFCGQKGTIHLTITDIDRKGSQEIYGSPISKIN